LTVAGSLAPGLESKNLKSVVHEPRGVAVSDKIAAYQFDKSAFKDDLFAAWRMRANAPVAVWQAAATAEERLNCAGLSRLRD
jgi:hypothetical protein